MRQLTMCMIPVLALGCDLGPTSCTTELRYSVTVTVEDETGAPVADAVVEYTVDGGDAVACEEWTDGEYVCGAEVSGDITVTATADGLGTDEETVTVESDECHVIGEAVTLTLPIED